MNYKPDAGLSSLIGALGDNREGLRQFAMRRIVNRGTDAMPALIHELKDSRPEMQESVTVALVTIQFGALNTAALMFFPCA